MFTSVLAADKTSKGTDLCAKSSKVSKLSYSSVLSSVENRFLSQDNDVDKDSIIQMIEKESSKDKRLMIARPKEGKLDTKIFTGALGAKESLEKIGKNDDKTFRKYKEVYDTSAKNILRNWIGMLYGILILRMNLVKFLLQNLSETGDVEGNFKEQVLLESKTMFKMVKDAQHVSQDQFLFLWTQLKKLMLNRVILRNALQSQKLKEPAFREWKTAAMKLMEMEKEVQKWRDECNTNHQTRKQLESSVKEKLAELEKTVFSKEAEYNTLLEQMALMKKREVQTRGKILINMRSYKDLKTKKQRLKSLEEEMNKLRNEHNVSIVEYSSKIRRLKGEIEDMDRMIEERKDEKIKLRAAIEGMADMDAK